MRRARAPSRPISAAIVQGILRDEMGYDGIVVTDSLGMGAVSAYGPQAAVMALQAGCDMPLMPEDFFAAYERCSPPWVMAPWTRADDMEETEGEG